MEVRVRIAPSPTGEDLHVGNVYTGLINFAYARKNKGKFVIRIEDTDRTRLVEGSEAKILQSLKNFNLNYDEGPDIGGPFAPYRQSERLEVYKKYADELINKDAAYTCFCPPEKLEKLKLESKGQFKRHQEICDSPKSDKFVIRLKVPDNRGITFDDLIRGKITINTDQIDDQILIKSDGFPTYHMAVVVDDHLMEISHVIRADEWISSTPKHVLLYEAFGWQMPIHAHVPLLRNTDKSKLSKRSNPVWVSWYLEQGYLPEAMLNFLALMGWSHPEGKEIFTMDEFIQKFDLVDLKPVGPVFDLTKLEWINGEYIRQMSDTELEKRLDEYLVDHPAKGKLSKLIPLIKDRIKKLSDFIPLTFFFFENPEYDLEVFKKLKIENLSDSLAKVIETLEKLKKPWNTQDFETSFRKLAEDLNISVTSCFQLIRVAISGQPVTPPLFESIQILGEDEAIKRVKEALKLLQAAP